MTILDDGSKFIRGLKNSGHKKRRAERQKKKIKKAKKVGDSKEVTRMKAKRKKTIKQKKRQDKRATVGGIEVGKRVVKGILSGGPIGMAVEFI